MLEQQLCVEILYEIVYEKSIATKVNDLDFCLDVV